MLLTTRIIPTSCDNMPRVRTVTLWLYPVIMIYDVSQDHCPPTITVGGILSLTRGIALRFNIPRVYIPLQTRDGGVSLLSASPQTQHLHLYTRYRGQGDQANVGKSGSVYSSALWWGVQGLWKLCHILRYWYITLNLRLTCRKNNCIIWLNVFAQTTPQA